MRKVTVYRFKTWIGQADEYFTSTRWATPEAAAKACGSIIEGTGIEVDESAVGREIEGMTERGYNPNPRTGFQTSIDR